MQYKSNFFSNKQYNKSYDSLKLHCRWQNINSLWLLNIFLKKKVEVIENPSNGTIWIAKTYPPWQSTVMTTLKKLYKVKH